MTVVVLLAAVAALQLMNRGSLGVLPTESAMPRPVPEGVPLPAHTDLPVPAAAQLPSGPYTPPSIVVSVSTEPEIRHVEKPPALSKEYLNRIKKEQQLQLKRQVQQIKDVWKNHKK